MSENNTWDLQGELEHSRHALLELARQLRAGRLWEETFAYGCENPWFKQQIVPTDQAPRFWITFTRLLAETAPDDQARLRLYKKFPVRTAWFGSDTALHVLIREGAPGLHRSILQSSGSLDALRTGRTPELDTICRPPNQSVTHELAQYGDESTQMCLVNHPNLELAFLAHHQDNITRTLREVLWHHGSPRVQAALLLCRGYNAKTLRKSLRQHEELVPKFFCIERSREKVKVQVEILKVRNDLFVLTLDGLERIETRFGYEDAGVDYSGSLYRYHQAFLMRRRDELRVRVEWRDVGAAHEEVMSTQWFERTGHNRKSWKPLTRERVGTKGWQEIDQIEGATPPLLPAASHSYLPKSSPQQEEQSEESLR